MSWYWWILMVILGLNAFAIAMLGMMMLGDWFAQRRGRRRDRLPPQGESADR